MPTTALQAHYAKLKIDPHTHRLVFSYGLKVDKALALYHHFADRVQLGFGIGTQLGNDVGLKPLNIVMKLAWPSSATARASGDGLGRLCGR